jgi:ATP-dependent DNA ligase
MEERLKQNSDAALKTAFEAFGKKLSAVEEEIYQVRNRSNQDPLNFPIKLNNKLAALERVVESGDGRPNASSYTVFKELSDQAAVQKGKLDAVLKTDLPAVNKLLADRNLKALEVTATESKAAAAGQ